MRGAECRGEKSRSERGDDAVGVRDPRAHGDKREHVEMARAQRLRPAYEERPAAPEHHRRYQCELHEARSVVRQRRESEMPVHLQHHDRQCEDGGNPEAAAHIGEFATVVFAARLGLERHAADRAGAGPDLPDFRMHGAGVDRPFRHGR